MSELTSRFYETAENLASTVQSFWKLLKAEANFQVDKAKAEGVVLADQIALLDDIFKEIEQ